MYQNNAQMPHYTEAGMQAAAIKGITKSPCNADNKISGVSKAAIK